MSQYEALLFYKYFAKIKTGKYIVGVAKINNSNRILSGEKYEQNE